MKKYFSILISLVTVLSILAVFAASAGAASLYVVNNHEEDTVLNPIANVQRIAGADLDKVLDGVENLGVALFKASEVSDINSVLTKCSAKGVVPTIHVATVAEADGVLAAVNATKVRDITFISEDSAILSHIRTQNVFVRNGLIVDLTQSSLTSDEANAIRQSVRSAPATFCVVKSTNASKQAVAELQALAVAVWVEVEAPADSAEFTVEAIKAVTSGANGIISADAAALTEVINANLAENTMTRTPIMIGHRGNPTQAPENSLSGFITAYENGADIFEIDVEITSDGEIIIMHDGNLTRTTNYTGGKTIGQMTLAEVKEYYLLGKDGSVTEEKVPTLREVLEEFKDKDCRIFVEFKGSNARNVAATAAIIKEYGMEDRVDVISFNSNFLTQTQTALPGMSTGFLCSYSFKSSTYEEAVTNIVRATTDAQKSNSTINCGSGVFSVHFEQAATDRGITVWPWTYLKSSNNSAFIAGCDGLTTDDVQWAKDMVKYIQPDTLEAAVSVGASAPVIVSSVTYGGVTESISSENLIVKVLSGEDCVKVENGAVVGVSEGTAGVIYGYSAKTTDGSEYVLYTQPVTVSVVSEIVTVVEETPDYTVYIIIGVAAVLVIAIAVAILAVKRKKV